ncbi:uncharacterized protein LOC128396335 [Panonychus citri]|uniref:uncharacterized protein LOC128396335 n=1 Tax=Panonychus citri TaxID=50023 RepID=UPI00230725B3|nr:uncharacterized protein LOC128396335 [Panonychus citri]
MTTTIQGEKSAFMEHMKKRIIEIDEENSEEEIEIDIDTVNITIERKSCLSTYGSNYGNFWSKDPVDSSSKENISKKPEICTIINIGNGEHNVNGKIDGNNCNNQEFDSDEEEITKEDVEAIHEQLTKANAILNEQIIKSQGELAQVRSSSIAHKRLDLRKEIGQIMCQKQKYLRENVFLRSLCLHEFSKRFHDKVDLSLDKIRETIKADLNYVVQSKSLFDASQDPGTKFRSSKSAQTIRTMALKGGESSDKLKNDTINSLKQHNLNLTRKLEQLKADNPIIPIKGPRVMLIKKDDYLKLLESSKGSTKNDRTKLINCDRNKSKSEQEAETIKPKSPINKQVIYVKKDTLDLTNGDSKRQFYICKCGQKFSKNALGYKAAYDSFRQHVAKCSVYMKNGAVCDICDAPFHSIPCLKVHIRRIHPERPELLEKYRHIVSCPCGKIFDNYSQECTAIKALRKHARACPSYRSKAIFCYICKEPFLEPNQLNNHIRMAHSSKSNGITSEKSTPVSKSNSNSNVAKKRKVN